MEDYGFIQNCIDERGKVTHSGQMLYRGKFLEKWCSKNLVEKDEDGNFRLSSDGEIIMKIF